jgi:hypothetical protein
VNAYVADISKEKPVAAIIRPSSKHAKEIAARRAALYNRELTPEEAAAFEIAKQYPDSYVSSTKDTPSMLGTGYKSEIVVAPMEDYTEGDDVVYLDTDGKKRVLHRITHKKPGYFYLKGTFNKWGDGWIPADRIVGKVVHPKPKW